MSNKLKKDVIDLSKYSRDELEEEYIKLYMRCAQAEAKAGRFLEEFKIAQQKRYGKSSEINITGQMSLDNFNFFNEAEASASEACEEPKVYVKKYVTSNYTCRAYILCCSLPSVYRNIIPSSLWRDDDTW